MARERSGLLVRFARNPSSEGVRIPHQFRTKNGLIKSQRTRSTRDENAGKSTKTIYILPLIAVWLKVRVLSEPTTKSIAIQSPVRGSGGLSPQVSGKCLHRQRGAACIAPNAEKFDNQKPRAASFLFVRRGTQSYDEFIAAVPLLASPEHDARDDQHVQHFLDWRKRKCDHVRDKTNALQ
jgi:hypothetical protein